MPPSKYDDRKDDLLRPSPEKIINPSTSAGASCGRDQLGLAAGFSSVCRRTGLAVYPQAHAQSSDEALCDRRGQAVFSLFCGEVFRHELPFDRSPMPAGASGWVEERIATVRSSAICLLAAQSERDYRCNVRYPTFEQPEWRPLG
jgi:hypothetical protein